MRRGFSLVEMLVGLVVMGVLGAAMLKILLAERRADGQSEAWRNARAVARASLNLLDALAMNGV